MLARKFARAYTTGSVPAAARSRLNLVALLALLVTVDLAVGRIFLRLVPADAELGNPLFLRVLRAAHGFVGQLAAVFGWLVLVAALLVIGRRSYYRASTRLSLILVGSVLAALVAVGLFGKIPGQLLLHLYLSFFFVAASAVLALLGTPAPLATRLGVVLLLLPAGLHYLVTLNDRFATFLGWSRRGDLLPIIDGGLLVGAALAMMLMRPRGARRAFAYVLALVVTAAATALVRTHWDIAQRIALNGFGLELPLIPAYASAYCIGLGAVIFLISAHLNGDDPDQLRAYGLLLLVANGLQLHWPSQLAIAAVGLLCLLESMARPDPNAYARAEIDALLRHAAVAVGTPTVSVTGPPGHEAARLAGTVAGAPVELAIAFRHGALALLEVTVASAPPRDPPFSIEHVAASHLGPRADGPRLFLDDIDLDRDLLIYDRRSVGALIFDDSARQALLVLCKGWLGVWPQRGLRYRARALPRHEQGLAETVALLGALWQRVA